MAEQRTPVYNYRSEAVRYRTTPPRLELAASYSHYLSIWTDVQTWLQSIHECGGMPFDNVNGSLGILLVHLSIEPSILYEVWEAGRFDTESGVNGEQPLQTGSLSTGVKALIGDDGTAAHDKDGNPLVVTATIDVADGMDRFQLPNATEYRALSTQIISKAYALLVKYLPMNGGAYGADDLAKLEQSVQKGSVQFSKLARDIVTLARLCRYDTPEDIRAVFMDAVGSIHDAIVKMLADHFTLELGSSGNLTVKQKAGDSTPMTNYFTNDAMSTPFSMMAWGLLIISAVETSVDLTSSEVI